MADGQFNTRYHMVCTVKAAETPSLGVIMTKLLAFILYTYFLTEKGRMMSPTRHTTSWLHGRQASGHERESPAFSASMAILSTPGGEEKTIFHGTKHGRRQ